MSEDTIFGHDFLTIWEEYRKAAKRSRQLKSTVNRTQLIGLLLLTTGAIFGVLAQQADSWNFISNYLPKTFALLSGVSLAVAAFVSRHVLDSKYERQWLLARSQAEALKSEAYIYLVKAPPYDGENRDRRVADKAQEIVGDSIQPVPLTTEEKREKLPKNWLSMDTYIKERVVAQIQGFYEPKTIEYENILKRLRLAGFILGIVGVVLATVSTTLTATNWPSAWIAVIGTISGALTAFTFARRYQYLVTSYGVTAQRLKWLRNAWYRMSEEEKLKKFGHFIRQFEDAISVENSSWVAEWTTKIQEQVPGKKPA